MPREAAYRNEKAACRCRRPFRCWALEHAVCGSAIGGRRAFERARPCVAGQSSPASSDMNARMNTSAPKPQTAMAAKPAASNRHHVAGRPEAAQRIDREHARRGQHDAAEQQRADPRRLALRRHAQQPRHRDREARADQRVGDKFRNTERRERLSREAGRGDQIGRMQQRQRRFAEEQGGQEAGEEGQDDFLHRWLVCCMRVRRSRVRAVVRTGRHYRAGPAHIRCSVALITKAENLSSKKSFQSLAPVPRLISQKPPCIRAFARRTARPANHPDSNAHHACGADARREQGDVLSQFWQGQSRRSSR